MDWGKVMRIKTAKARKKRAEVVSKSTEKKTGHLFKPGQSGNPNGRPKGGKNKLAESFLTALAADFDEFGIEAIRAARTERPAQYIQIVASLVPKDVTLVTKTHEQWLAELGD
jgi:hypothetical protein